LAGIIRDRNHNSQHPKSPLHVITITLRLPWDHIMKRELKYCHAGVNKQSRDRKRSASRQAVPSKPPGGYAS